MLLWEVLFIIFAGGTLMYIFWPDDTKKYNDVLYKIKYSKKHKFWYGYIVNELTDEVFCEKSKKDLIEVIHSYINQQKCQQQQSLQWEQRRS